MSSAAAKNNQKWIVRDSEGRIFGPFSTEQVLEQIDKNYFLGGEQVASYPGGDWISISKAPEFYDRLLDVLAAEVKSGPVPESARSRSHESTQNTKSTQNRPQSVSRGSETKRPLSSFQQPVVTTPSALAISSQEGETDSFTKSGAAPDIELADLNALDRLQQLKSSRVPLMIIAVVLVFVVLLWFLPTGSMGDRKLRLLMPKKNQPTISEEKLKEKFRRAMAAFQSDTFKGYQRAENELVEMAEGASTRQEDSRKRAEVLSFLCLTYRELWPFAYQDARDMRAVSEVMQEVKRIDPGGLHGSICELVHLMLNGRHRDAQGLAESVLLEKSQSPVLFEIRGDLFSHTKDFADSANYFGQARSLWPGWQKSAVQEARARGEVKQFAEASQLYREVLTKVPEHGVAKIELGLIEAIQFNQFDKGRNLIMSGVEDNVPRPIASRGYLGLAMIYVRKQQTARAKEAAKKAYELNPTNTEAKELLVTLGGDGKLDPRHVDLMSLGEELMRNGDFYSAQAQFRAAYDANPRNGLAALKAGKCLWQLNQSTEAIEWMRKAVRADPQLTAAYVELADYYAQRHDYYSGMEVLKQAQSVDPSSFEVLRGFAVVEFRRNNYKGAIAYGQRAMKVYETDIDTLLLMAKSHLGLQQFQDAQKYVARAIDLDYNNTDAHSVNAKVEAGLHGVDSAILYVQQLLNRYVITRGRPIPQAAIDLRITQGEIYLQDEGYKRAEDLFRQAISLDPNSKRALIALGKVLQHENRNSEALEFFLRAAVLDPSDAEPVFLSGQLYAETGKLVEALRQFERVQKINPRFPKAHAALGRVALKRGDAKRALEEANIERSVNPDLADAYTLAAEAYFALHQYSNCAAEYQQAVAKAGQGTLVLVRMARCYRLSGALESAQSLLRQAISLESGNPDIYKEQGAIYHTRGLADEAVGAYDTYIRLAPNAGDRGDVEARIRKIQAGDLSLRE